MLGEREYPSISESFGVIPQPYSARVGGAVSDWTTSQWQEYNAQAAAALSSAPPVAAHSAGSGAGPVGRSKSGAGLVERPGVGG